MPKLCAIPDCDRAANSRGWCLMHYKRWRKHGDPLGGRERITNHPPTCTIPGCDKPYEARGLCVMHYSRLWSTGSTEILGRTHRHGMTKHPLYATWSNMNGRCENPTNPDYHLYGGRGVYVDPRWFNFARFVEDMGPKPTPSHSLDRIDSNGPYSPENCRWATPIEQVRNRRPYIPCRGDASHLTKVSDADVARLREAYAAGATPQELADRYGISVKHAGRLGRGALRAAAS